MLILVVSLLAVNPTHPSSTIDNQLAHLWRAICLVESGGDPHAVNRIENAVGIVQIRPCVVADCNRIVGKARWSLADRTDPIASYEMFRTYLRFYAPAGSVERWARIWNGGPSGDKKASTLGYWGKVQTLSVSTIVCKP
jgi:hypothetical protein